MVDKKQHTTATIKSNSEPKSDPGSGPGSEPEPNPDLETLLKELDRCIRCGTCIGSCPVVSATTTGTVPGPRGAVIEALRAPHELEAMRTLARYCTTCGACQAACPSNISIPLLNIALRGLVFDPSDLPEGHKSLLRNLEAYGRAVVPYSESQRASILAAKGLASPKPLPPGPQTVLYFPGCIANERLITIPIAVQKILDHCSIPYTLPEGWVCCGSPVRKIGANALSNELFMKNLDAFLNAGGKTVITSCAGCSSNLREQLEALRESEVTDRGSPSPGEPSLKALHGLQIKHIIEFLYEDVGVEKLQFRPATDTDTGAGPIKVALHHPCHLARSVGSHVMEYAEAILERIPGIELVQMDDPGRCCGGGGGLLSAYPEVSALMRATVLEDARRVGTTVLIDPCPFCVLNLAQGVKDAGVGGQITVEEFTWYVAKHLEDRGGE